MTRDDPAPKIAAAMPAATDATLAVPTASVAVSLAAVVGAYGMTGAVIAVTRTVRHSEPRARESHDNQTRKSHKE
jgi:hypothetical protein